MDATATWWDSVELWVAGLPFIPQVLLVLVVVIPVAAVLARIVDRLVSKVWKLVGAARRRFRPALAEGTP